MNHLRNKNGNDKNTFNRWLFRVERMFSYMTRIMENKFDVEAIFIGFSFARGEKLAEISRSWLMTDFDGCLLVNIVNMSVAPNALYAELMQKLQESTMGLFFLHKDIEEVVGKNDIVSKYYYSRPNVNFELGFLVSHVAKFGNSHKRITLLTEPGLTIPTDFQDFSRFDMSGKIEIDYIHVIGRIIAVNKSLTKQVALQAVNTHFTRLQDAYNDQRITVTDLPHNMTFQNYRNEMKGKLIMAIDQRFPN